MSALILLKPTSEVEVMSFPRDAWQNSQPAWRQQKLSGVTEIQFTTAAVQGTPYHGPQAISHKLTTTERLRMTSGCANTLVSLMPPAFAGGRLVTSEWQYDQKQASTRYLVSGCCKHAVAQRLFHAGLALSLAQWDLRAMQTSFCKVLQT